ncbi:MAG: hypothetical protein OXC91_02885 [Rhodobacteraceae bacterium]|nr:hypothetical protein [Paracoccaceae bacterium]
MPNSLTNADQAVLLGEVSTSSGTFPKRLDAFVYFAPLRRLQGLHSI